MNNEPLRFISKYRNKSATFYTHALLNKMHQLNYFAPLIQVNRLHFYIIFFLILVV